MGLLEHIPARLVMATSTALGLMLFATARPSTPIQPLQHAQAATPVNFLGKQQAKLLATDGAANDYFGAAVALSADGDMALSGVPASNGGRGAVYLFARNGVSWTQQTKLSAPDGLVNDSFGASLALSTLSANPTTLLVGADNVKVGNNSSQGAAYVFIFSGSAWTQQVKLIASDGGVGDLFGSSVALSADGNTALIGAPSAIVDQSGHRGAAYVFTRSGISWTQQVRLADVTDPAEIYFGSSVALSSDGNTALIGAIRASVGSHIGQGAAFVYTRSGTSWTLQKKLSASDGKAGDELGWAVDLSDDGNTALLGTPLAKDASNLYTGAAYIFTRSGISWTQQTRLVASAGIASDTAGAIGSSVALSGDGHTALVGADSAMVNYHISQGAGYLFTRSGISWAQKARLVASDGRDGDNFGQSVALSDDGDTALLSAPNVRAGGRPGQGAAYVYAPYRQYLVLVRRAS